MTARGRIDIPAVRAQLDLLGLAGRYTTLRRVASSGGGEWAGPCPFCGGSDRFRLQPQAPGGGRWLCRQCTDGKWQDGLELGKRLFPELPFAELCARLVGSAALPRSGEGFTGGPAGGFSLEPANRPPLAPPLAPPTSPAYQAPPDAWQAAARHAIQVCAGQLFARPGQAALAYLQERGLQADTLRAWQLGYSTGQNFPLPGGKALWLPAGVVIPCLGRGEVWYLKVALLPGSRVKCERCGEQAGARRPCPKCGAVNKYRGVRGNRPAAIFGADDLPGAWLALFVEGEFDALIAWQELRDVAAVCTLGSAANRPDLATWGAYLAPLTWILAAYDADDAGGRGLKAMQAMSERVRPCPLPPGAKDINDFTLHGGQLWPWFKAELEKLGVVE